MSGKVQELELKLMDLLLESSKPEVNLKIQELTRDLIQEGENVLIALDYTHSVSHLFGRYGQEGQASYLSSKAQLPIAEELVNYTLKKVMIARDFGCVSGIVDPIMKLNLAHLEENPEKFIFKPKILTDPDFIQGFSSSKEAEYSLDLIDFCKSKSIGEFFPKYVELLRKKKELEPVVEVNEVIPGIFIDVEGTLIKYGGFDEEKRQDIYRKLDLTQEYALKKMEEGIPVTIFTGGSLENVVKELKLAGVDERLCQAKPKAEFIGKILETCVDDIAPAVQGFRARTHYKSGRDAWDAEYSVDK